MTPKYAHVDTTKPDGFYVEFEMLTLHDDDAGKPDENDDGFWPSMNPKAAGYVSPENFLKAHDEAKERMRSWHADEWHYIGVRAQARCTVVINGRGTMFTLESAGLWGTESDSDPAYLKSIFEDEKAELLALIEAMKNPVVEA